MSTEISRHPQGDASANVNDPFLALLQGISPYIDDILMKPEFHRFLDLPIELRCKIYDQYFLDNTDSIACKTWPNLRINRLSIPPLRGRKTRCAFLPKLCLVTKALQEEQLACLISPMHLDCKYVDHLAFGTRLLQESLKSHCLLGYVRDISIRRTNGCYMRVIDDDFSTVWTDGESEFDLSERCEILMDEFSTLLPKFPRLRQLSFAVHAPLQHVGRIPNGSNLECVRAQPINSYMDGFDVNNLLGLKELTKLTMIGSAGSDNCPDEYLVPALTFIEEDGKNENLQSVKDIAREIKDGFKNQDQGVVVELQLRYGGDKSEEIVME